MLNILVVEDNLDIAVIISNILNNCSDYKVVGIYKDGREAYNKIILNDVDVVILDLGLPNLDGIEILRKLKGKKDIPKIIVISGDRILLNNIFIEKLPVYYTFIKPFDTNEILKTLDEIKIVKKNVMTKESRIGNILRMFNFNTSSLGYKYLLCSIDICIKNGSLIIPIEKNLFSIVAKECGVDCYKKIKWNIEKSILSMIRYTDENILSSLFGKNERPTPKVFISRIYEVISNE